MTRNTQAIIAPLALILPLLLCDCTSPTPYTQLDWGMNNSYPHQHVRVAVAPVRSRTTAEARTYVYRGDDAAYPTYDTPAQVVPRPRPDLASPPPREVVQDAQYTDDAPAGAPRFAWPVSGHVISDFGNTSSGERNDGINIATRMDEPIHAAAGGTITYEGNELKGYGNLILIRHADGYVTAYAHAAKIVVTRGEVVSKGQVIGYAGETGDVRSPQLHFEIRHDTLPVNPRPLLVAWR